MENPQPNLESLTQSLKDTPITLRALTANSSEDKLRTPPQPGEWSVVEILAHLHSCGEVWTPSIFRMLAEDHPTFREIHPRQKAKKSGYAQLTCEVLLEVFSQRRESLLSKLDGLPLNAWQRGARIDRHERTVFSHIQRMASHEAVHLEQLENTLLAVAE